MSSLFQHVFQKYKLNLILNMTALNNFSTCVILIIYTIFLSPQKKRCVIITYKHLIYELPHELPNDLRNRILGQQKISGKFPNFIDWQPGGDSSDRKEIFVNTSKTLSKTEIKLFLQCAMSHKGQSQPQVYCERLSLEACFTSDSPKTSSKLISLKTLLTLGPFTQF